MFQRLVAIPQEEYMQLSSVQQARQPITQQFYNVEKRYRDAEDIEEPYKRLVYQSEALDEMKDLKEKMRHGILEITPKPYQSRAKTLFQSLEPFLKFNERGEIYTENEQLIPQSRLEDLIQHAVRDRRRNLTPKGWKEFRNLLQLHNAPKFMLNRDTLDEMSKDEQLKKKATTDYSEVKGAVQTTDSKEKGNKTNTLKGAVGLKKSKSKKVSVEELKDRITLRSRPTRRATKYPDTDFLKKF